MNTLLLSSRATLASLAAFGKDHSANISVMFAGTLPLLLGCAALAVDVGSLYTERRQIQGAVDLAAVAAASNIDHRHESAIQTLAANGVGNIESLNVVPGRYTPDLSVDHTDRFTPDATPHNAVKVVLATKRPYFFAQMFMGEYSSIQAEAVAATSSNATFSIGSRLLAVRDGIPNQILEALIGGQLGLSVMDYNALASAQISLGDQLQALAGELNITAGTYSDVLLAGATLGDWLDAMASVAGKNGDGGAQVSLEKLIDDSNASSLSLPLSKLISLGPFGSAAIGSATNGLAATFNALELVTAAAQIANLDRQISLELNGNLPGIASLRLDLAIGEPAQYGSWSAVGMPQASIYTAQTRLRLMAEISGGNLLSGSNIRLPLYLDVANAQARLDSVTCQTGKPNEPAATIAAKPGIFSAWIGEPASHWPFTSTRPVVHAASLVQTPLVKVRGHAFLEASNTKYSMIDFSNEEISNQTIKRTDTTDVGQTLLSSLLRNLRLEADVAGLSFTFGDTLERHVRGLLSASATPIDGVLTTVLETLGVHLGEVDLRVHSAVCGSAVLAG